MGSYPTSVQSVYQIGRAMYRQCASALHLFRVTVRECERTNYLLYTTVVGQCETRSEWYRKRRLSCSIHQHQHWLQPCYRFGDSGYSNVLRPELDCHLRPTTHHKRTTTGQRDYELRLCPWRVLLAWTFTRNTMDSCLQ